MKRIALLILMIVANNSQGSEWVDYYEDGTVVIQAFKVEKEVNLYDGDKLYRYFVSDGNIICIEEICSVCTARLVIRYLYDEDGTFISSVCNFSHETPHSKEWQHRKFVLMPGNTLDIGRYAGNEKIDDWADRALRYCLNNLQEHNEKEYSES